jgi:hypothetical protein
MWWWNELTLKLQNYPKYLLKVITKGYAALVIKSNQSNGAL